MSLRAESSIHCHTKHPTEAQHSSYRVGMLLGLQLSIVGHVVESVKIKFGECTGSPQIRGKWEAYRSSYRDSLPWEGSNDIGQGDDKNDDSYIDFDELVSFDPHHEAERTGSLDEHVSTIDPALRSNSEKSAGLRPKGILKSPTLNFAEELSPTRGGVAPLPDTVTEAPPGTRWTKIALELVSLEALTIGKERFEVRNDFVIVLRVLSKEEIRAYATATSRGEGRSTKDRTVAKTPPWKQRGYYQLVKFIARRIQIPMGLFYAIWYTRLDVPLVELGFFYPTRQDADTASRCYG
ncbi:hypothetical protein QBC33DRAFT_603547 [Phialemonium atrogriseum]|uniref:DUF8035 domain-containing protein n=1 Tax=Phialemonium atrogriseum TaxID=1093897 RepID=A0AAJ0C9M6_9PEZI|nr:uncharacterized protein QBC33DRAFT_603547 [Phialemonium atrogriseum]KAK1770256.1 hypothetical protein QBC33DRAFT_603547 [Phialemonium atrogriseum]